MENLTSGKKLQSVPTPVADIGHLPGGTAGRDGLPNIPFLLANANATSFASTFWIERVKDETEKGEDAEYAQLQYSQTAILDFGGLKWPHITVGTLIKQ